jgi:hypothetical protein
VTQHDNVYRLHADLFARDGHLTMLTLDRFEVGELSTAECETVIDHVESCAVCSHRLASMRADAVQLRPPAELHDRVEAQRTGAERSRWGALAIATTVAAAAALLVVVMPEPQQAERAPSEDAMLTASPFTTTAELEGAVSFEPALDFSVVEAASSERVQHGDRVSWDTTLTLRVSPHEAGFVAVVSATDIGDEDLADTDGGGTDHVVQVLMPVTRLEARSGPHALKVEHASRFAPETADEQLMAIYCEDLFELDDPFDPSLPGLREGCTSVEVTLTRFGEVADS